MEREETEAALISSSGSVSMNYKSLRYVPSFEENLSEIKERLEEVSVFLREPWL